jgi:hypothetical protein
MGRGGTGGHVSGKNRCEIRAKHKNFGKILICPEKNFVSLRKLRDVMKNFLICPEKFSYVCRKVFGKSGKIFFGMSGKKILVTSPPPPPPARQQFWGEILMFSLPVRANYTVPPQTRLGPYAHASAVALHQGIKQVLLLFNLCYVIKSCQTYFHE